MMTVNADKPHLWKADVEQSIDFYNDWFLRFAPETFRAQRAETTLQVANALEMTDYLRDMRPEVLQANPGILPMLRMICAPPLARDRLMGLAHLNKNLVLSMEGKSGAPSRMPPRMSKPEQIEQLQRICDTLVELADRELFSWLEHEDAPTDEQVVRSSLVVADRLCGAASDPIIRNAQEQRQLSTIDAWLKSKGYAEVSPSSVGTVSELQPGCFAFRMNVQVGQDKDAVIVSVDCVIQPHGANLGDLPVLIEAKSAGDTTNTNKRRKEEAQKYRQLVSEFGSEVTYVLFLCGYFEPGYLGYEASEGIDWVWEHRLSDLELLLEKHGSQAKKITEVGLQYEVETNTKENQRFAFQQETDASKTQGDRNKMGQFSTPFSLAEDIVTYAHSLVAPNSQRISFLEPALGSGVFFSALESNIPHNSIDLATGIELDVDYAKIASDLWAAPPFEIRNTDFLEFSSLSDRQEKYSLLCANPPYVRHHHLLSASKLTLQNRVAQELQLRPSGLSGLYVYFMLLSHNLLQKGGIASWLVPSEFLSVNYGRVLREYLLRRVTLVRIHQFDPADVQFDDALVSSCVVTYKKNTPTKPYEFEFSYGGTLNNPKDIRVVNSDMASSVEKWSYAGIGSESLDDADGVRFGDIFDIKRGIATGSNGFFIVDKRTIEEYDIPDRFLQPILPSPRYISEQIIDADDRGNPAIDSARHLVNCDLAPDGVKKQFPNLWRYFELGESKGIPEGYLCASRKIWYLQEQREPAMYMATYMVRSRSTSGNPFRFFLNKSTAVGTNVFLLLYPKTGVKAALVGREDRMLQLLSMLNGLGREQVLSKGRTYGGGLHKLEPKELANLQFSDAPDWLQGQTQMKLEFA